jgi:hypothetical protein
MSQDEREKPIMVSLSNHVLGILSAMIVMHNYF